MPVRSGIHLAETDEERQAVYRLRYEVYVTEMGRYQSAADHVPRLRGTDLFAQRGRQIRRFLSDHRLGKSNIIACSAGDRILKNGGVARNMFVVLDGTVEVRNGDPVVRALGPGDVFGEIALLLEQPRSADGYAATDGVRVSSLSESTVRQMIERDAEVAATLLLNTRSCCACDC